MTEGRGSQIAAASAVTYADRNDPPMLLIVSAISARASLCGRRRYSRLQLLYIEAFRQPLWEPRDRLACNLRSLRFDRNCHDPAAENILIGGMERRQHRLWR